MAEISSIDDSEREKIKLERFKVKRDIFIALITVLFGTVGVAYMNNVFQARQLEQQQIQSEAELKLQEKKSEAEHRQAEMKYLGHFITYALEDDLARRLRFAEYFATLITSPDLREKWKIYHAALEKIVVETQTDDERLRVKQKALPTVPHSQELDEHNRRRFELNKNWRPLEYIENEFEVENEIVFNRTTKLTWQKSKSDSPLTYDKALSYINKLNKDKFAGYDDWRLPSILELISLLKKKKHVTKFYINPIFDVGQNSFWSADIRTSETVWNVNFHYGDVYWGYTDKKGYVRAVR